MEPSGPWLQMVGLPLRVALEPPPGGLHHEPWSATDVTHGALAASSPFQRAGHARHVSYGKCFGRPLPAGTGVGCRVVCDGTSPCFHAARRAAVVDCAHPMYK
ncbi:unnamed protein product [Prorocentrum cordatum]|uniref:Uncharacterized protein n=1 Tax=Prorocentrum cordatum TaxID=2364126 RepID=A0ABN9TK77_9DINO|nr:unnamed protein product [Polarella glacialis]